MRAVLRAYAHDGVEAASNYDTAFENSDVLLFESVALAAMKRTASGGIGPKKVKAVQPVLSVFNVDPIVLRETRIALSAANQ
jgi:hypothetical protein